MRRFLRWLGLTIAAGAALIVVLVYGFGLHLVSYGSGMPRPAFGPTRDHYAELERQRAAQRAASPPPAAVAPATAPISDPAAALPASPSDAATSASAAPGAVAASNAGASPASASAVTGAPTAAAATAAVATPASGYWTGFRGPRRDGVYTERPIRTAWPQAGPPLLWKQPVGEGFSSFVAGNGRAYTIEQRRRQEVVAAYDVETGRERWTHPWDAYFADSTGNGPRATPAFDEGRVYALGGEGELRCLEAATGRLVWRKNILSDNGAENTQWAMSASPLVVGDHVIVLPGGKPGRSVVAYDKRTGARVWSALDDPQAYTAPMVATLNGVRQLVIVSALRAAGLALEDGRLLWEFPWVTDYNVNAAQPIVVAPNRLFLSAGYGHGSAVIEITPTSDRSTVRTVWQNTRMKNKFASSVLHDGFIYGLDEAILACIDASTGELKWKGGRYGYGQLILAGNQILVMTERGELAIVRASPASHQEVVLVPAIDGKTWNHPALEGGRLLVRNGNEMAAFDLRP